MQVSKAHLLELYGIRYFKDLKQGSICESVPVSLSLGGGEENMKKLYFIRKRVSSSIFSSLPFSPLSNDRFLTHRSGLFTPLSC